MKSLVVYDSVHGNTKKIADIIASTLKTKAIAVASATVSDLTNLNLLIMGSPTLGGQPSQDLLGFINSIPEKYLKNTNIAAFDTRFEESVQKFPLRLLMKTIGYASAKIIKIITAKGGRAISNPQGFIVTGTKGPLKTGEVERAKSWARTLIA